MTLVHEQINKEKKSENPETDPNTNGYLVYDKGGITNYQEKCYNLIDGSFLIDSSGTEG